MNDRLRRTVQVLALAFATATVRLAALDFGTIRSIAIAPSHPSIVYAAGTSGVFETSDGGATWAKTSELTVVDALAVDPLNPATVWAGAYSRGISPDQTGLFRSSDGAATWAPVSFAPDTWPVYAIAFQPASLETILIGTSVGPYRSPDGGASWSLAQTGLLDLTNVYTIAFAPSSPNVVYAGSAYLPPRAGVYRSADGGVTWTSLNSQYFHPDVRAIAVDPSDPNVVYISDYSTGIAKSRDGGATWSYMLLVRGVVALAADPSAPGTVYAGVESYANYEHVGGLLRTSDGGETWESLENGLANPFVECLAIDPARPARIYAGTANDYYGLVGPEGVYESADAGGSWRLAAQGECADDPIGGSLCLNAGRFRVAASWRTHDGASGEAHPIANTADSGAFWFFSPNNVELVVKVVDGRAVNGHFWVFGGQLTDVEYTLTVTDMQTGAVWTHTNSLGTLASFADTAAF